MHFQQVLVRECTDISYVAGEGVQLTVHYESVVVEEIKEVELTRSHRAQFFYDRNYNRFGSQARGHAPSRLASGEKVLKTSVTQKEGSKGVCIEGIRKNITSYYSSTFTINAQPRCRSLRSVASCFASYDC